MSGSFKSWLLATCVLGASLSAKGSVNNGDFETGTVSGWTPIGAAHTATSSVGITPTQGTFDGYIDNTGNFAASAPAVATSLGVAGGDILALGAGTPTTGSCLSQDVTVSAGDVLTFDWNFITDEHNEAIQYNDFAIFSISSTPFFLVSRDSSFSTLDLVSPPAGFDGQTHWATQSYTFPSSGTFKIGFAVFNVADAGHNSVLLLDSVAIAVPEPGCVSALMLAAAGLMRRRH